MKIHLTIAGRKIPFEVEPAKEEIFRKAEREANQMISQIKANFQIDDEGVLCYATALLALDKLELSTARKIDDDMAELTRLDRMLEAHLAKLK